MRRKKRILKVSKEDIEFQKKITNKEVFKCWRCGYICNTKEDLVYHNKYMHGVYPLEEHRLAINGDPVIKKIFMDYRCPKKDTPKSFNPKKILENYKKSGKGVTVYTGEVSIKGGDDFIDIFYIYDKNINEYRIFTEDMKELVFSEGKQCFVPKQTKSLPKQPKCAYVPGKWL